MYGQRIPVGLHTAARVNDRGTFSCPRCRHWQRAEVLGVGAAQNVQRTLRFAACPKCKARSGHAAFVAPYLLASFAAIAGAVVFAFVVAHVKRGVDGADAFQLYFPLLVAAMTVIVTPYSLLNRWKHNDDRIRWLDF